MGKRYYCDYCDRSFKDDPEARKKHLTSLQHARNRSEHYDQFKDSAAVLKDETAKTPCKRFMLHGDCAFGSGCRFSHYTPHMLWELEQHVLASSQRSSSDPPLPRSSDIIEEFFENATDDSSIEPSAIRADWKFPVELQNYPSLPPSLWPINPEAIVDTNFGRWGK